MRVAILSNLYPPYSYGGAEQAAYAQAKKLQEEGNEVFVITLKHYKDVPCKLARYVLVIELPHKNIFNYYDIAKKPAWLRFLWHIIDTFNFWLANDIKKILEHEKPDLVIMHNMKGLSFLTPFKIQNLSRAKSRDLKIHLVVHDVSLYTPSGLIEWGKEDAWEHTGVLTRIYRFLTRRLMGYPEKVFFPSAWLLNFYRKNGFFTHQEKIYKPNEIDFQSTINNQQSTINSFLFVGKLERHKGILLLLDAFQNVESSTLNIVGDGSLMPELKNRAQNNPNIKIHGQVPREELKKFYSRAKAVIVPSIVYENAPNVVYEALSCGASVIVSRIGGAHEPVREGKNGYTFEPGNINELAEKMKKYL
ncbi:glycosyltransferase [Patescibacteria group bacterium]|nr:glycosyltransferase [Patescibacteria group bacterium]